MCLPPRSRASGLSTRTSTIACRRLTRKSCRRTIGRTSRFCRIGPGWHYSISNRSKHRITIPPSTPRFSRKRCLLPTRSSTHPRPNVFAISFRASAMVPLFLEQAASNLLSVPAAWCKAAMVENQGAIDWWMANYATPRRRKSAGVRPRRRPRAARAAQVPGPADQQAAVSRQLQLAARTELYNRKFRLALESGGSAQDMLESGEKQLVSIRARMYDLALPLYRKLPSATERGGEP